MATILYKEEAIRGHSNQKRITWPADGQTMGPGDDGTPYDRTPLSDGSVNVFGTFGGAVLEIEGRNTANASAWAVLHNSFNEALSFTSGTSLRQVHEISDQIRPKITGGAGTTLTIVLIVTIPNKNGQ